MTIDAYTQHTILFLARKGIKPAQIAKFVGVSETDVVRIIAGNDKESEEART